MHLWERRFQIEKWPGKSSISWGVQHCNGYQVIHSDTYHSYHHLLVHDPPIMMHFSIISRILLLKHYECDGDIPIPSQKHYLETKLQRKVVVHRGMDYSHDPNTDGFCWDSPIGLDPCTSPIAGCFGMRPYDQSWSHAPKQPLATCHSPSIFWTGSHAKIGMITGDTPDPSIWV